MLIPSTKVSTILTADGANFGNILVMPSTILVIILLPNSKKSGNPSAKSDAKFPTISANSSMPSLTSFVPLIISLKTLTALFTTGNSF